MIKFFRKIRQKLIEQHKVRSYFFYAIGEIILVVIGILIALWINNIKIVNQEQKEAYKLVKNLENELLENQTELIERKLQLKRVEENFIKVINYAAGSFSELPIDSIKTYISESLTFGVVDLKKSQINSAKSSGKFSLLTNDLSTSLAEYENATNNYKAYMDKTSFFDELWFDFAIRVNANKDFHQLYFKNIELKIHPEYLSESNFIKVIKNKDSYKKLYQYYTENVVELAWLDLLLIRIESTLKKIDDFKKKYED